MRLILMRRAERVFGTFADVFRVDLLIVVNHFTRPRPRVYNRWPAPWNGQGEIAARIYGEKVCRKCRMKFFRGTFRSRDNRVGKFV